MPGEDAPEHHPARFPLRGRGRGRVDGRGRRRGTDEARRLPAAGRLELARTPQRQRGADGVDRRARHPVSVRHRGAVLRVRPRRDLRRGADHPGAIPLRAALGAPRPAPAVGDEPDARIAAIRLQVGVHRPGTGRPVRHRGRRVRRHSRARPRRSPVRQPGDRCRRAADDPRRDAPGSPRRRDHSGARDGLVGLPGLRRLGQGHGRREVVERHTRRPLRRAVMDAVLRTVGGWLDRLRLRRARLFRFSDAPVFEALQLDRIQPQTSKDDARSSPPSVPPTAPAPSDSRATCSSTWAPPTSASCSPGPPGGRRQPPARRTPSRPRTSRRLGRTRRRSSASDTTTPTTSR